MAPPTSTTDTADAPDQPLSRRDRKRNETRQSLVRAAIEHFEAKGFEDTTVVDIAESADVDPSTFFRHFGTKEAVLFTDMEQFVERGEQLLAADDGPLEGSLIEKLQQATMLAVSPEARDPELHRLRARLQESSPHLQAVSRVYVDRVSVLLAEYIGRQVNLDPDNDPLPYLLATLWVSAFAWYRERVVAGEEAADSPGDLLGNVTADITRLVELLQERGVS